MTNFVGYMFFSSIEFISMMLLTFSLFTFDVRYYKKELLITSVSVTLLSYLFIIFNIVPFLIIAEFIILILIYKFCFKQSWKYSLWITFAGLAAFIVIQSAIAFISIQSGLVTASDTSESFGFMPYLQQSITATIVTSIAAYIRFNRQGFGFTFRTKFGRKLYTTVALISVIICSFFFYLYATNAHHDIYFYLATSSFGFLFLVSIVFSFIKDREEFSFA